jgi:hypothetical protein
VLFGMARSKWEKASRPPADAPTATTAKGVLSLPLIVSFFTSHRSERNADWRDGWSVHRKKPLSTQGRRYARGMRRESIRRSAELFPAQQGFHANH